MKTLTLSSAALGLACALLAGCKAAPQTAVSEPPPPDRALTGACLTTCARAPSATPTAA